MAGRYYDPMKGENVIHEVKDHDVMYVIIGIPCQPGRHAINDRIDRS
jgi:hypothetical protein